MAKQVGIWSVSQPVLFLIESGTTKEDRKTGRFLLLGEEEEEEAVNQNDQGLHQTTDQTKDLPKEKEA